MNRAQLGRRAHIRLTLIADDLVRKPKFFQQPQHALGAGIVEMMDGEHGDSPSGFWPAIWSCQPGIGKSRCPGAVYYPGIIDKPNLPGEELPQGLRNCSMNPGADVAHIAFEGDRCIASADLRDVISAAKQ